MPVAKKQKLDLEAEPAASALESLKSFTIVVADTGGRKKLFLYITTPLLRVLSRCFVAYSTWENGHAANVDGGGTTV